MSADFMTVRLHLPGVRVTGVGVDTPTELVVGVVSVKKLSKCPHCGCSCRRVHDRRLREIRDLEHGGRRTVLLWTPATVGVRPLRETAHRDPSAVPGRSYLSAGAQIGPRRPSDAHPCGGVSQAPTDGHLGSYHAWWHRIAVAPHRHQPISSHPADQRTFGRVRHRGKSQQKLAVSQFCYGAVTPPAGVTDC